jgi:histidinol dehydrogenase
MSGISIAVQGRLSELSHAERGILLDRSPAEASTLTPAVAAILADVRDRGDRALLDMAARFDGVDMESVEVPMARCAEALEALAPEVRAALERAAANIRAFHQAQRPDRVRLEVEPGVVLERRWSALEAVGVYAPGGRAAYPSSVLMGVIPAKVAGVGEVVVCSPPAEDGLPPKTVLAAAALGGATRVFALGGAGAVAAMAFGTESVPGVAAIVGPGNQWVTEAKRQVAGDVQIDSPAGPSELLVVATEGADPERIALELIAQAEHDPEAAVALVTPSERLTIAVRRSLETLLPGTPRLDVVGPALAARGGLVTADSLEEALDFASAYGAEHLAIYTDDPWEDARNVVTAGTVFIGEPSAVAFGDYLTGANHVLPTAGLSASYSGLSTMNFLRSYTVQALTAEAASAMARDVATLAMEEGLPGHAAAALARLTQGPEARGAARIAEEEDAS